MSSLYVCCPPAFSHSPLPSPFFTLCISLLLFLFLSLFPSLPSHFSLPHPPSPPQLSLHRSVSQSVSLPHSIHISPLCTSPCSISQLFPPPPSHLCLFTLPLFVSVSPSSLSLHVCLSVALSVSPLCSSLFSLSHGCQRHFCDLQLVFSLQLHSHKSDHWQVWPLHGWDMRTCGPGTTLKGAGRAGGWGDSGKGQILSKGVGGADLWTLGDSWNQVGAGTGNQQGDLPSSDAKTVSRPPEGPAFPPQIGG